MILNPWREIRLLRERVTALEKEVEKVERTSAERYSRELFRLIDKHNREMVRAAGSYRPSGGGVV